MALQLMLLSLRGPKARWRFRTRTACKYSTFSGRNGPIPIATQLGTAPSESFYWLDHGTRPGPPFYGSPLREYQLLYE